MLPEKEKPLADGHSLAGKSSTKGSNSASRHSDRIARMSECKKRSRQMAKYLQENYSDKKLSFQVSGCATNLVFNNYYTIDEIRLAGAITCKKHLLCPMCARLRAAKQVQSYLSRFNEVVKNNPNFIPAMITLTVKNGDSLDERFSHLVNSFRTYLNRRRTYQKTGRGFNELCKANGGVFSYETTNNSGWHPHLHGVVLLDDYMDPYKLSEEWKSITGDSYIVDVRKLKVNDEGSIAEAFVEVFKYALKFADLSLEDNLTAYHSLKGKRLQGSFGSLWGVKVPETLTDDLFDELPFLEMFYRYLPSIGSYDLQKVREGVYPDGDIVSPCPEQGQD